MPLRDHLRLLAQSDALVCLRSAEYNVLYLFTPKESLAEKTRKGQGAQRQSYHFVTQVADELETLARTREQRVPANLGGSSERLREEARAAVARGTPKRLGVNGWWTSAKSACIDQRFARGGK